MLHYCAWEFGEKQRLASFDKLDDATDSALIAMGVMEAPEKVQRDEPTIPDAMRETYGHFKRLRFGRSLTDTGVLLIPRQPLTFNEIHHYINTMAETLSPWQVDVIMSIDAIFNHRSAHHG